MEYIKKQILHQRKIGDRQLLINNDGTIELNPGSGKVKIAGDLEVTGASSGPTDANVYYVSLQGSDDNDGLGAGPDRAKRTVKSAVEAAPAGATIQVSAGDFYENNPITLKERQTVRGDSLRNTQLYPNNPTDDFFFVDNACYIFQVTFRALRDPGWCVRIKPGALVTVSPYVQNCTNMNGPWLNDGTEFTPFVTEQIPGVPAGARPIENDPAVPFEKRVNETGGGNGMLVDGNDYDQRSLVFSMVADAFTQIAQGGIGFHITNFGYTQIVSCFSVFTRIGFFASKGGYLSISNSVSDFGTFAIIADGVFDEIYTTARPAQDYRSRVGSVTVNSTGSGYTAAPQVVIDPPSDPNGTTATATATVDLQRGEVTGITVIDQGDGYTDVPNISLVGGGFTVAGIATANLIRNQEVVVNSLRDIPQTGSIIQFTGDSIKYYVTNTDITTRPFIYDETVCRRDVRRIVDAVMGDVTMGTNYQALAAGRSYLRATSQKVLFQQLEPTIYGIEAARDEILDRLPEVTPADEQLRYDVIEAFGTITTFIANEDSTAAPDVVYEPSTAVDDNHVYAKDNILLNKEFILEETLDYIRDQFTELSYNQDKCERDVRLLVDAIVADVALGTTYNTITAGLAYLRANSTRVVTRQLEVTLAAFGNLQTSILGLPGVSANSVAEARVNDLFAEFFDILNGSNYNQATCERDLGYILDSVEYDVLLGTNYNAVTAGLSYARAPSAYVLSNQFQQTIRAVELAKTKSNAYLSDSATAQTRSDAAYDEIVNLIRGAGFDEAICRRDIGFLVDSVAYDIYLGTNFNGVYAGLSYQRAPSSYTLSNEFQQTIEVIENLKTEANTLTASDATAQSRSDASWDEILDIVNNGTGNADALSWTDPGVVAERAYARQLLQSNRDFIATQVTNYINSNFPNLDYDQATCERDIKYIVDAVSYDIQYGGNSQTRIAAQSYFDGAYSVLPNAQKEPTVQAMNNLEFVMSQIVLNNVSGQTTQANEASTTESDDIAGLVQLIEDVISENSTAGLPSAVFPDTSWAAAGIITAGNALVAAKGTLQDDSIDFLTKDIFTNADDLTFTDPGPAYATKTYARTLLQVNKDFIADELVTWINANLSVTYDEEKCKRDTRYIVDAASFDIQYDGNFASRRAADAYFSGTASQLPASQQAETAQAYDQLATICSQIIAETYPGQTTTGNAGGVTEQTRAQDLIQIVEDVITADSLAGLPALVTPTTTWVAAGIDSAVDNLIANESTLIDEVIAEINVSINNADTIRFPTPPETIAAREYAKLQLIANKEFIQEDVVQFVNNEYPTLDYNESRCRRDVGYIVDALIYDMLYEANTATLTNARSYFVGAASQLGEGEATATAAAYEHMIGVVTGVILESAITPQTGNTFTQDTAGSPGTSVEVSKCTGLLQIIIDVIEAGNLDDLPGNDSVNLSWVDEDILAATTEINGQKEAFATQATAYILANYPDFTYDRVKCRRDVGLILDALSRDMKLNTNHNGLIAGLAYRRASAAVVDSQQLPATIIALREAKRLSLLEVTDTLSATRLEEGWDNILEIIEYGTLPSEGFTYPAPTPASQELIDAARQLQENKDFLIAEVIATVNNNYFVYDSAKCRRDSELILKAVTDDLQMGTNYNSVTAGLAYYNANAGLVISDQLTETVAAVTQLKSEALSYITDDAASTTTVGNLFDEVIDILQNGVANADALTFTNPLANANATNARTLLQLNRTFIISELISWINTNFPSLTYDQTKCERDTGYLIDAISYDVQYETNQAVRQASFLYFEGTTSQLPADQRQVTASAYTQLGNILSDIVVETYAGQTTNGSPASATESTLVAGLAEVVSDVIAANTVQVLPAQIDLDLSGTSAAAIDSAEDIYVTNKTAILDDVIEYINLNLNGFSYNIEKCERDTGYIIEAATHDLLYTGNISSLISARAYFDANANQISGQEGPTVAALTQLRDVAVNVIEGVAVVPTPGNAESQSLVGPFGTSTQSTRASELFDITIDAIQAGDLTGTPGNVEPDFTWVAPTVELAADAIITAKSSIQDGVIDFITDNIIAFDYDTAKCRRDTSYIIDAALYDMMYGGNKQTRRAGEAYYSGAILSGITTPGDNADQIEITEFTYKHIAQIMSDIAQNKTVTKSPEVVLNQAYGANAGSPTAGSSLFTNVAKIGEVIKTYELPDEVDHNYATQGISANNTQRIAILNDLQAIEDASIAALNLEYGGVAELTLFPAVTSVDQGTLANMQNVSTVSTSGHAFEYVGAGITYNALPFFGGSAIQENEFVERDQGKVFAGGVVDQIGNFRVGNFFNVNALTGAITLNAEEINLNGIASIGPFKRFGIPVGVELKEVSNSFDLTSSTGAADQNTVPTQPAVVNYVENRYLNKLTGGTVTGDIILNGDFDVNGDVISTDTAGSFNLLNTTATEIQAFGDATIINMGADTGLFTINPDLLVQGNLTVNGDIVLTGDYTLNIPDESIQAYSISTEGSLDYISINTRTNNEQITFGIRPRFLVENDIEATAVDDAGVVFDGGLGVAKNVIIGDDLVVDGSVTLGDDRAVDTIDINGVTDIDLPDNLPTVFRVHENITDYIIIDTVDDEEKVEFGATPNVIIQNQDDAISPTTGALQVAGGVGVAYDIYAGVDITARRDLIAERNLEVNGNTISTRVDSNVFNLLNENIPGIRAFGEADDIEIGAATGILTINNEQVILDSVVTLQIPVGTTLDRPTPATGQIRFNTDTVVFEGYDGIAWGSLGGVKDVDQDTFIRPESSPNADNDELEFFTAGSRRVLLDNNQLLIESTNQVFVKNNTQSVDYQTGAFVVDGGVGIAKNLHVQGFISGQNNGVLQLTDLATDKILIKAETIESPEQLRIITGADDSSGNEIIYPISLVNRSDGGSVVAGAGTGLKFELETTNANFEVTGIIDVEALDITGNQEDFDMVFRTMIGGVSGVEKLRLGEDISTFTTGVQIDKDLTVTGILDAAGFTGSVFADDSTRMLDAINNNLTVTTGDIGELVLTTDLEVQYGGTGVSTFTENGILYGNTADPVQVTDAAGTSDIQESFQILTVTSDVDATPVWTDTIDGGTF